MANLAEDVQLEDINFYLGDPDPVFERMRDEDPVFMYEPLDMWVISKYEDVRTVSRAPQYSCNDGILINDFRYGDVLKAFFPEGAENFALEDPPRHNDLRRLMIPPFGPRIITGIEARARDLCIQRLDTIKPGESFNWSKLIAEPFPLIIIALLLGLPVEDLDDLKVWSDAIIDMSAATTAEGLMEIAGTLEPMGAYFEAKLAERRIEPAEDLLSALEAARAAGDISNETVHMMLAGIMAAGNETNRSTMNGTIIALAEHPDQMTKLVEDPTKVRVAVEEFLRWVTPVRGFGRTVKEQVELNGKTLTPGQRVYMMYTSANRDAEAFENPFTFDVERAMTKPQLAFGFGQHACVGSALARMELKVLFEEVAARFSSVTVQGFRREQSLLQNAWGDVMVTFEK